MNAEHYEFDKLTDFLSNKYIFQYISDRKLSDVYHSHDFYEICYVVFGQCRKIVNENECVIGTHDLLILRPGDRHLFCGQSDNLHLLSLSVQKDEFDMLADAYSITLKAELLKPLNPVILKNGNDKLSSGFVQTVYNTGSKNGDCKLLLFYLFKIYSDALEQTRNDIPGELLFALNEIKKRENLKLGLTMFVRMSNYSQSHLSRLMKKHFNTTIHNYILNLRLETAYNDLILTNKNSEEISEEIGFKSFSHFNKIFKEKYGITPSLLRKSHGIWTS